MEFSQVIEELTWTLATAAEVRVGEWQGMRYVPQGDTIETEDFSFTTDVPVDPELWAKWVKPNLPWAEEHFQERISGIPYNPPPSHVNWPFATRNNEEFTDSDKFSHTYPERIWPKFTVPGLGPMAGIRYQYGDLGDVIDMLISRPGTRQAYLPIWFPEDTGPEEGRRVPCTLGYHFMIRQGKMKIVYYIRSCDFYRHFRDDVYMAGRLLQHVAEKVGVEPDRLVMHISSMHIFTTERKKIQDEASAISSV
jgi:Thymidylate synthase